MARKQMMTAAALGFLAVLLGAFGAHGLKGFLADLPDGAQRLAWWTTGVRYQMWHALFLGGVGLLSAKAQAPQRILRAAGVCTVVGVFLFSGSLYVMTLSGIRVLGAVTPFGGLSLLAAWTCFGIGASRVLRD